MADVLALLHSLPVQVYAQQQGTTGFLENCLLCGLIMQPGTCKRRKRAAFFLMMTDSKWKPSDYVWRFVRDLCTNTAPRETIALCMPCVHWTSRCMHQTGKSQIMMDTFIEFALHPGDGVTPDERILTRFCAAFRVVYEFHGQRLFNPYTRMLPVWALAAIVDMPDTVTAEEAKRRLIGAWWDAHGCPVVLPNREVTSLIRREIPDAANAVHARFLESISEASEVDEGDATDEPANLPGAQ